MANVKADLTELNNLMRMLKTNYVLRIGIIGNKATTEHDDKSGLTNAEIGTFHEFGSASGDHPPRRSFLEEPLKMKSVLYNYACKILLKQVTIFLKLNNAKANFTFEHRRNTHYNELQVHIKKIIDTNKYVLSIKPLPKIQSKCLQLADIIASSTYQAFEPNQYDGDIESLYLEKLKNNLFIYNNKCLGYGLKLFPYSANILEQTKYNVLNIMLNSLYRN